MSSPVSVLQWKPLTPEGEAMVAEVVNQQYNEIASKYGAKPLPAGRANGHQGATQACRYRLRSALDVMQTEPIRWRIKGVIPERGISSVYGPSGSGKSFLVMDMAMHLARGDHWFGYRVTACPVVYVCLEGEAGLSVRLKAHSKAQIPDRMHFIDQPLNLLDKKDISDLVTAIRACNVAGGVVIIDTLNRAAPGMDENSSVDMGHVIQAARLIQQAVGGLVLLVHHSGKDASKGMRGHSSLHAALDAAIEVTRTADLREWSVAKAKDGADGKAHLFRLEVVELGLDQDGDRISSCRIQALQGGAARPKPLTAAQQIAMTAFRDAASKNISDGDASVHAHVNQWRDEFYRRSTADSADTKKRAFHRARQQLIELGRLVVKDDVYRLPVGFSCDSG